MVVKGENDVESVSSDDAPTTNQAMSDKKGILGNIYDYVFTKQQTDPPADFANVRTDPAPTLQKENTPKEASGEQTSQAQVTPQAPQAEDKTEKKMIQSRFSAVNKLSTFST